MRKEEKQEIVQALAEQIKSFGNFYIADTADLTVEKNQRNSSQMF